MHVRDKVGAFVKFLYGFLYEDAVLINDSDDEIVGDEEDVRKVTAFEALDIQNVRQSTFHMFYKK